LSNTPALNHPGAALLSSQSHEGEAQ
jgi:hypothetical protein